jgi:tRNA(Ile)-lysidine synthase TilS/MesJ
MEILKNQGLEQKSYQLCQEITAQLPRRSVVRKRLKQWLTEHLAIQKEITSLPLLVSSDIIESLFGNFKHVIERSSQADMNRTALLIPALCGEIDETVFENALNHARYKDLKNWKDINIPYTARKKRQNFSNQTKGNSEIQKSVKTSYV